ncbi:hypothetical protein SBOR_9753 [Sclerotinia borealis F-4128]|uniref:RRM domain-containing protein n=1 Tax=Sclerotinia borealis (strain F-4128) TaxID=1432307 RepID=W9BZ71_SCLBF|nr:hypothetical protein SBOR_9753 [Sclerotinia borealis F-4128]
MDFTVGKSWYNKPNESSISDNSSTKHKAKGKGKGVHGTESNTSSSATDGFAIERDDPAPFRARATHVQRLETLASQAEHDQDEDVKQADLNSMHFIQPLDREDKIKKKLNRQLPVEMTFGESMKGYSPPKRSRWADVFETRRFDRKLTPPNFITNTSKKPSSPKFVTSPLQRMSPPPDPGSMVHSNVVSKMKSPLTKKIHGSKDSKRFREFLARSDSAMPLFISPTGTNQQFFPATRSSRPSNTSSVAGASSTTCLLANSSRPSNNSHLSVNHSMAVHSLSNSRGSRSSTHTRTSTNHSLSTGGTVWSPMDRSFDSSVSQRTDHTRMSSASSNFAHQPAIPEHHHIIVTPPAWHNFDQASPEMLPPLKTFSDQGMALSITPVPPQSASMAMDSMMGSFPDLSHLVKKFRPTNMLLREQGMIPDNSRQDTNYEGDENHPDLLGLPDDINCCMWIINIPPEVQHGEFMRLLDCGAVAALSLVPPQRGHVTQAAKATFKKVTSGAELYRRARHRSGLRIRGQKIKVWYNDYGAYEWTGPETRFLEIEAPVVLDDNFWRSYFNNWCKNIVISIQPLHCAKYGFAFTRFEFVRIAGQAQTCFQAIQKDEAFLGQVNVQYGIDPYDF